MVTKEDLVYGSLIILIMTTGSLLMATALAPDEVASLMLVPWGISCVAFVACLVATVNWP
jgi:hypothetical protein